MDVDRLRRILRAVATVLIQLGSVIVAVADALSSRPRTPRPPK